MSSGAVRSTFSLDPAVHRALRLKATRLRCSMSNIVNDAVRAALREDEEDLAIFDERAAEQRITYEELLAHRTDFYQHDQHWSNGMILGDSLQVRVGAMPGFAAVLERHPALATVR